MECSSEPTDIAVKFFQLSSTQLYLPSSNSRVNIEYKQNSSVHQLFADYSEYLRSIAMAWHDFQTIRRRAQKELTIKEMQVRACGKLIGSVENGRTLMIDWTWGYMEVAIFFFHVLNDI